MESGDINLGDNSKHTLFKAIRMADFTMKVSIDGEQKLTKDFLSFWALQCGVAGEKKTKTEKA